MTLSRERIRNDSRQDDYDAPPKLGLTILEAAFALGLGRTRTLDLIHAGRLRHVRVGKRIIVPVREIEKFLEREAGGVEE
jgi:excisionase family DNA binding protein